VTTTGQKHAPVHPGQILRGELVGRGMTQQELAKAMGRPYQAVSLIVTGKKRITADTAIDLEEALGIDAEFWLGAQYAHQAAQELAQARRRRAS
jgi:HTH-type transcriptional regulator/antitoxin HigA